MDFNDARPLLGLDDKVLQEVVREGELKLQAQLSIAASADQRALTIIGFQSTILAAVIAGSTALALSSKPDNALVLIGYFFATALLVAAFLALHSIKPKSFTYPGNRPGCWLPDLWLRPESEPDARNIRSARVEQCICLENAICANQLDIEYAAKRVKWSLNLSLITTAVTSVIVAIHLIVRFWGASS
jgi:hypothetical protein